jgi:hypothetical protein
VWLGQIGLGDERISQSTDQSISNITHITGGPVGTQRNNTFWIGEGLVRAKKKVPI